MYTLQRGVDKDLRPYFVVRDWGQKGKAICVVEGEAAEEFERETNFPITAWIEKWPDGVKVYSEAYALELLDWARSKGYC